MYSPFLVSGDYKLFLGMILGLAEALVSETSIVAGFG